MKDSGNSGSEANKRYVPLWAAVLPALVSLVGVVASALITVSGNVRISEIQRDVANRQLEWKKEVDRIDASIRQAELNLKSVEAALKRDQVSLEQRRFDAEQQDLRDQFLSKYIPQLFSSGADRQAAIALMFVLYPEDAAEWLQRVAQSLDEESAKTLEKSIERATTLSQRIGDWAIVFGADKTLDAAKYELERAAQNNYSAGIYLRNGWFASVIGPFPTQIEAERQNISVRATLRDSAYVVNLGAWCPRGVQRDGYTECQPAEVEP